MLFIRIALMVPLPNHARVAVGLLNAVANYCHGKPGYLGGYVLQQHPVTGAIGRVTLWEDEASADAVAGDTHMLSLRAALGRAIDEDTHQEFAFVAERAPMPDIEEALRFSDALAEAEQIMRGAQDPPAPTDAPERPGGGS